MPKLSISASIKMAASSAENRMNLAALQQCDPYIDDIVQTATQVALYTFNGSANEWVSFGVILSL